MIAPTSEETTARLNARFGSDIRGLLKRHHVPCAGENDLRGLGEALFMNAAFRSDLFALCNSISHMEEHDLNADELLDLVVASFGAGLQASVENRAEFSSAYQGWHARELAIELPQRSVEAAAITKDAVPMSEMDETLQRISESSLELKMFLADVKQRVTEIDPELQHLEQMIAQMKLGVPAAAALGEAGQEAELTVPLAMPGDPERARVRRLRWTVGVLSAALGLALGDAAWLAQGRGAREPVTIVDGNASVTGAMAAGNTDGTAGMKAALTATHVERRASLAARRAARPGATSSGATSRGGSVDAARVPAPIIRRNPDTQQTGTGTIFVPASTMIGYALASPNRYSRR